MVDKKRLYLMIGMARFHQRNDSRAFRIHRYYQRDYIAFALIRNFLLTTIAYVLLLAVIVLFNLENFLSNLNNLEIRPLAAVLIVGYLVFLGVYSVLAYILARLRYVRMQNSIAQYEEALSRMNRMYREEQRMSGMDDDTYEEEDEEE